VKLGRPRRIPVSGCLACRLVVVEPGCIVEQCPAAVFVLLTHVAYVLGPMLAVHLVLRQTGHPARQ
jgi:hypothetical protein